jgi:hypothetical protein
LPKSILKEWTPKSPIVSVFLTVDLDIGKLVALLYSIAMGTILVRNYDVSISIYYFMYIIEPIITHSVIHLVESSRCFLFFPRPAKSIRFYLQQTLAQRSIFSLFTFHVLFVLPAAGSPSILLLYFWQSN